MLGNEGKWGPVPDVLWLRLMDSNQGVQDLIGTNDGTLNGGMAYATVGGRECAEFDGVDDHVSIPDSAAVSVTGNLTLSCWFRTSTSAYQMLMCKYTGTTAQNSYFLFLRGNGGGDTTKMSFFVEIEGSGGFEVYGTASPVSVFDGNWHHIAGTYDGTNLRSYIDGTLANTAACTGSIKDSTTDLNLGRAPGGTPYYFAGYMNHVRIYNRALSAAEVARLARIY
jgi:hypothetical protein